MRGISRTILIIALVVIVAIAGIAIYLTTTAQRPAQRVSEVKVGIVQPLSGSVSQTTVFLCALEYFQFRGLG